MTVLSVIQSACTSGIALTRPTSVFGSSIREMLELAGLVQETAEMIASAHEWEKLNRIATITGDGTEEDFDLPTDYDRMPEKSQLWTSSLETPLTPVSDRDEWLGLDVQSFDFVVNAWIKYGGQIHIKPAPASAEEIKYWYQSNLIVAPNSGANKAEFDTDTDTFRIDERLLKLGLIWKWREMKGLPYAENMADYERALAKRIHEDKGSRIIRIGRPSLPRDAIYAYPKSITGA
jgi:hypothetical protein